MYEEVANPQTAPSSAAAAAAAATAPATPPANAPRSVKWSCLFTEYLHRGDHELLRGMSLYLYTMHVTRVEKKLQDQNETDLNQDTESFYSPHCEAAHSFYQKVNVDSVRVPQIQGWTYPSPDENEEEFASYLLTLFYPIACEKDTVHACNRQDVFAPLHAHTGLAHSVVWDNFWRIVIKDAEIADQRLDERRWTASLWAFLDDPHLYFAYVTRDVVCNCILIAKSRKHSVKTVGQSVAESQSHLGGTRARTDFQAIYGDDDVDSFVEDQPGDDIDTYLVLEQQSSAFQDNVDQEDQMSSGDVIAWASETHLLHPQTQPRGDLNCKVTFLTDGNVENHTSLEEKEAFKSMMKLQNKKAKDKDTATTSTTLGPDTTTRKKLFAEDVLLYAVDLLCKAKILPTIDGDVPTNISEILQAGDVNWSGWKGEFGQFSVCLLVLNAVLSVVEDRFIVENDSVRVVLQGEGGSGKSYIVNEFVFPLLDFVGMKREGVAFSNAAANLLGGVTQHRMIGTYMNQPAIGQTVTIPKMNAAAQSRWASLECLVIDEMSMSPAYLLHVLNERAREMSSSGLEMTENTFQPGTVLGNFGTLPIVILMGDVFQLNAPGAFSLLADPDSIMSTFSHQGIQLYRSFPQCVVLTQLKRTDCPLQRELLTCMRRGDLLSDNVFKEFSKRYVGTGGPAIPIGCAKIADGWLPLNQMQLTHTFAIGQDKCEKLYVLRARDMTTCGTMTGVATGELAKNIAKLNLNGSKSLLDFSQSIVGCAFASRSTFT